MILKKRLYTKFNKKKRKIILRNKKKKDKKNQNQNLDEMKKSK